MVVVARGSTSFLFVHPLYIRRSLPGSWRQVRRRDYMLKAPFEIQLIRWVWGFLFEGSDVCVSVCQQIFPKATEKEARPSRCRRLIMPPYPSGHVRRFRGAVVSPGCRHAICRFPCEAGNRKSVWGRLSRPAPGEPAESASKICEGEQRGIEHSETGARASPGAHNHVPAQEQLVQAICQHSRSFSFIQLVTITVWYGGRVAFLGSGSVILFQSLIHVYTSFLIL